MNQPDTAAAAPDVPAASIAPAAAVSPAKTVAVRKKPASKPTLTKATPATKKTPTSKLASLKAAPSKAAEAAKVAKSIKDKPTKERAPKIKMVRDSFTFPETDHRLLTDLKKRVVVLGHEVKKGELVRVGIAVLAAMDNKALLAAVAKVDKLKTGRPKK